MIKSILLLLFLPLLLVPIYGEIQQEIFFTTDKTEYYKDEPIFVSGTMTEIDWLEDTSISYNIKDVKSILNLGAGENITTLNNDGTFSFTIDFLERELWVSYAGNITFFITSQNATANIRLYISDQLNMSNEYLYEKSMIHEERISSHNSTLSTLSDTTDSHSTILLTHDTILTEHETIHDPLIYSNEAMGYENYDMITNHTASISELKLENAELRDQFAIFGGYLTNLNVTLGEQYPVILDNKAIKEITHENKRLEDEISRLDADITNTILQLEEAELAGNELKIEKFKDRIGSNILSREIAQAKLAMTYLYLDVYPQN